MVPILFKNDLDIKKVQEKVLGIDTRRLFKPLCSLKFIKKYQVKYSFSKNANDIYKRGIYIPSGHDLKNKEIKYISTILNNLVI